MFLKRVAGVSGGSGGKKQHHLVQQPPQPQQQQPVFVSSESVINKLSQSSFTPSYNGYLNQVTMGDYSSHHSNTSSNKRLHHYLSSNPLQVKKQSSSTSRKSSLKRFITNNSTSKVVKEGDIVIINVDEDCAILQMIDSHLHAKMGRVVSIIGDEVELDMIRDMDEDSGDDWIYIGGRVTVPIFSLCLEDRVLQSRLLS